ncbi:30S ribosomal protein S9 [Candidatus Woesearchaeota archaeon]|nr:30S ribosomal protein S9 [Candidatus Woesearchaeota archaeon]
MEKTIITQGKRKQAIAKAALRPGTGKIKINHQLLDNYSSHYLRLRVKEPLVLAGDMADKINIDVNVHGGGINGQADASRLAIARVLVKYDPSLKKVFDEYDRLLLVADVRQNEVSHPNDSKPRAKRQKSYR